VLDFSKIDDVIARANNTKYGLAAYIFTNDVSVGWKMAEGLEVGIVGWNDPVPATRSALRRMKESGMAGNWRTRVGGVHGDEVREYQMRD